MRGIKAVVFVFAVISICMVTAVCNGATSDAVEESQLTSQLISQYGADYAAPFAGSSDYVDLNEGSVNIKEADLSLPGKNGFDLNIYRSYKSNESHGGYKYSEANAAIATTPMYYYTYNLNGASVRALVNFESEEAMLDEFYALENRAADSLRTDIFGNSYYEYTVLSPSGSTGSILFTRDKSSAAVYKREAAGVSYSEGSGFDIEIGSGWYINMPQLSLIGVNGNITNTNQQTKKYIFTFKTESGEVTDLSYNIFKSSGETQWHLDGSNGGGYKITGNFTLKVYDEIKTHSLGFNYNLEITNKNNNKTYYFNLGGLNEITDGLPAAVTDKYNNKITYTQTAENTASITDSMGRNVSVSPSGILVSAGDKTNSVTYQQNEIYDSVRDPYGKLKCFTTYKLTVFKNKDNVQEKTEYYQKNKSLIFDGKSQKYIPKIEKIVYPTGACAQYEFESEPTIEKNAVGSSRTSTFDYKEYHILRQDIYENNALKNSMSYTPVYTNKNNMHYVKDIAKKTDVNTTMPDGTAKKSTYEYDKFGRLLKTTTGFGLGYASDRTEEIYSYSDKYQMWKISDLPSGNAAQLRKAYVMNTVKFMDDKLISTVDEEYNDKNQLTYKKNGEVESEKEYSEEYGILLESIERQDADTEIRTENILTPDNKNIQTSKLYENNSLKSATAYTYNPDGTVNSETVTPNSGESRVTNYTYIYNSDGSYSVTASVGGIKDADGNVASVSTTQNYDSFGRLASQTDANGNTTRYQYDAAGRIVMQVNPNASYKTVEYNIPENMVTTTDERGYKTTQDYSQWGNLDKIYLDNDPSEIVAKYEYDSQNRKTKETAYQELGGLEISENYEYDNLGRVKKNTSKSGDETLDTVTNTYKYENAFTKYSVPNIYNNYFERINITGSEKVEIIYLKAAASANDKTEIRAYLDEVSALENDDNKYLYQGQSRTVTLNTAGRSELKVGASNSVTIYVKILSAEDKSEILGGDSQTVTKTYTGDGTYVNPTVETRLDGHGNKVSETFKKHGTSTVLNKKIYKYDYAGNVVETLGGRTYMEKLGDYTTKTEYNYMNKPTREYRADGSYIQTTYDGFGNAITSTDYLGNTTVMEYDLLGRNIKTTVPFDENTYSNTLTYYDGNGNVIKTKQQNNKPGEAVSYAVTENSYDNRNLLWKVKMNDSARDIYTQYDYDDGGNMIKMVTGLTVPISIEEDEPPEGTTWQTYEYDRFGNVTKATDALGQNVTSEYNLMGLPTRQTDRNGNESIMTYNAYGSVASSWARGESGSSIITNTYSKNNLLISTTEGSSTVSYTYDDYGCIKTETANGVTNTYTNDVEGNRKSYTQKEGLTTLLSGSYVYDNLNRLTKADFGSVSAEYGYDANGKVKTETRGNLTSTYEYNSAGLLTKLANSHETTYIYRYRLDGNQTNKWFGDTDTDYVYNDLGQLVKEESHYPNWSKTYSYDTRGNRIGESESGYSTAYQYDKNNRLLEETRTETSGKQTVTSYSYDPNGNTIFKGVSEYTSEASGQAEAGISLLGDGGSYAEAYTYNEKNQLVKYQSGNTTARYTYDPTGRRQSKTVNSITTVHRWDGSNIAGESVGNTNYTYYRGVNIIAQSDGSTTGYYHYNGHGDITRITSASGEVLASYDYDAFGNETANAGGIYNPFRYNGQYSDSETGLIYLRARYYDPSAGRFITEDPAKDGLNWYSYCAGDPVNFVDPSGNIKEEDKQYGENSKVYIALLILGDAWTTFPEYRTAIEELANEVRWLANTRGAGNLEQKIHWSQSIGIMPSNLSTVEQVIAAGYTDEALVMNEARNAADKETMRRYGQEGNGTDAANAFKHIYWSAYATDRMGSKMTRLFTNAHEFGWYEENLNDVEAMKMDLHNNQLGRTIGKTYPKSRLASKSAEAVANGQAAVIRNGKSVLSTPDWRAW